MVTAWPSSAGESAWASGFQGMESPRTLNLVINYIYIDINDQTTTVVIIYMTSIRVKQIGYGDVST